LYSAAKLDIVKPLLIILSVSFILLVFWSVWRVIWDIMNLWQFFKKTPFYLQYADPDHEVEDEKS
jgi:hypothetical protein